MKRYFFILLLVSACTSYVQVVETKSNDVSYQGDNYIYEDESLKITYDLWQEEGKLAFTIYNKSERALYLDWGKSSFILGETSVKYWQNESRTESELHLISDSSYRISKGNVLLTEGTVLSKSTSSERIILIEPKTKVNGLFPILVNGAYLTWNNQGSSIMPVNNSRPDKLAEVYIEDYNESNTPFEFRNYLNFARKADFSDEFFIDTKFYVSKLQRMPKNHFEVNSEYYNPNKDLNSYPFKQTNSFFIFLPK